MGCFLLDVKVHGLDCLLFAEREMAVIAYIPPRAESFLSPCQALRLVHIAVVLVLYMYTFLKCTQLSSETLTQAFVPP